MSDGPASKDSSKLAIAAEEPIKAAYSHVESTSLSLGKDTVEGLKKLSIEASLIDKAVESLKSSNDAKLNTVNQSMSTLKDEVVKLNSAIARLTKNQQLEWAISNAGLNSFKFYDKDIGDFNNHVESTSLVKNILFFFRKDRGRYITNRSMKPYKEYNRVTPQAEVDEGEKLFRAALSTQIHELIGQEPRIALADKAYAIYYS